MPAEVWTAVTLPSGKSTGYGLGEVVEEGAQKFVGHFGGRVSAMDWDPQSKTAIVVLTNGRTNPDAPMEGIAAILTQSIPT